MKAQIQGVRINFHYWTNDNGRHYKLTKIASKNDGFQLPEHHYTIDVANFDSLDKLSFEITRILLTFALSGSTVIDHLILTDKEQRELNKQHLKYTRIEHDYCVWKKGIVLDLKNFKTIEKLWEAIHPFQPTHNNSHWGALDALATLLIKLLNKAS